MAWNELMRPTTVILALLSLSRPAPVIAQGDAPQRVRVEIYKHSAKLPQTHVQALSRHGLEVATTGLAGRSPSLLFVQKADSELANRVRQLVRTGQGPVVLMGSSTQSFGGEGSAMEASLKAAGASRVMAWDADRTPQEIRGAIAEDVEHQRKQSIVRGIVAGLNGEGVDRYDDARSRVRAKVKPDGSFIAIVETEREKRPRVGEFEARPQPPLAFDRVVWERNEALRRETHAQHAAEDARIGDGSPLGRMLGAEKPSDAKRYRLGVVIRGERLELRESFHGTDEIVAVGAKVVRAHSNLDTLGAQKTTKQALMAIEELDLKMTRSWLNGTDFIVEVVGRTRNPSWNVPLIVKVEKSLQRPLKLESYAGGAAPGEAQKNALAASGFQLDAPARSHGSRVPTLLFVQAADAKLVDRVQVLSKKGPVVIATSSSESLSRVEGKSAAELEQELLLAGAQLVTAWNQEGAPPELVRALYGREKRQGEHYSFLP